jgi:hypothetical protein
MEQEVWVVKSEGRTSQYKMFLWHHRYNDDHEFLKDDPCSRWCSTLWNEDSLIRVQ